MTRRAGVVATTLLLAATALVAATLGQPSAAAAPGKANLGVTLSGAPHAVDPGQTVTYTATVKNAGPNDAANVRLRDWIPGKASLGSATASQGSCTGTRPITCQLGAVAANASATVTVTVTANKGGWMEDQARVFSDMRDPHPANNIRVVRTLVRTDRANVGVAIAVSPRPAHVGQNVTYTLTVRNHGPSSATNVVAKDWLPAKTAFVSSSTSQGACTGTRPVVCSLGTLASGSSATVTIVASVTQSGEIRDEARAHSDLPDPAPFDNVRFAFVRALS
jgi:uncharacterized repeat protein (TIGR01451 family)